MGGIRVQMDRTTAPSRHRYASGHQNPKGCAAESGEDFNFIFVRGTLPSHMGDWILPVSVAVLLCLAPNTAGR